MEVGGGKKLNRDERRAKTMSAIIAMMVMMMMKKSHSSRLRWCKTKGRRKNARVECVLSCNFNLFHAMFMFFLAQ